jgi:hypothetical protein
MKDCQVDKTCRHCNKKHHQSICFSVRENSREEKPGRDDLQQRRHDDKMDTNPTVTTVSMSRKKGRVLLQTTKAQAYNVEGSSSVKVRILFDSGSQRTYAT